MSDQVLREAAEQPAILRAMFGRTDEFGALAEQLAGRFRHVLIAARGSSDNAARYGQYVLGARNGLTVTLAAPSLLTRLGASLDLRDTLTVGISQSGASPDVVSVLAAADRQGSPTLAITNDEDSDLATTARHVLALRAGVEQAVAATKTYTASLAAIAMLSQALPSTDPSGDRDLREEQRRNGPAEFAAVPGSVDQVLQSAMPLEALAGWTEARRGIVVGRGHEFATAHETALKLQELAGVIAQAHSAADVRHGPIGGLTGRVPTILFTAGNRMADDIADVAATLSSRSPLTTIGPASSNAANEHAQASWIVPDVADWLAPMVSVVAGQRLAIALAEAVGLDADQPAGLSKITRTR